MKRLNLILALLLLILNLSAVLPGTAPFDKETFGQSTSQDTISNRTAAPAATYAPTFSPVPSQTPPSSAPAGLFEIHFLDVGQADAALVLCDGHAMLIDGGNRADSSLIYAYLKSHHITHLDYIIATHGHEDHVGGLAGALNYAQVQHAYCSVSNYDSDAFKNFTKYLNAQNVPLQIPSVGDTFSLGSASIQILGVNADTSNHNNTSVVLRIVYGETSFLFTGDAERGAEQVILESGLAIESTVLKVGHHGSENSTTYPFLRAVYPKYAVISVGTDNSYGHPAQATLSRLSDAEAQVFRTDLQGHIICTSDGQSVTFLTER